jgi:hypothetical protein
MLFIVTTLAIVLVVWQQRRAERMVIVKAEPEVATRPQPEAA